MKSILTISRIKELRNQSFSIYSKLRNPKLINSDINSLTTSTTKSYIALKQLFGIKLLAILENYQKDLDYNEISYLSKKIFKEFYKKAYFLGVKSRGNSISLFNLNKYIRKNPILVYDETLWLKKAANHELKYWLNLVKLTEKDIISVKQAQQRFNLYINALDGLFNSGKIAGSNKYSLIHWIRSPKSTSSCKECFRLGSISPIPREYCITAPRAGFCQCLSNCGCSIKIQTVTVQEYTKRILELKKSGFISLV